MWNKLYDFAYDATVGLVKLYRQKTVELIRIKSTEVYLQILRLTRRHLALVGLALFGIVLSAVAIVVVPVALIMVSPCLPNTKIILLVCLGAGYFLAIGLCLNSVFSEERWLKASGFREFLESLNQSHK